MKRVSLYAAALTMLVLALGACGDDQPAQETAPAVTGATGVTDDAPQGADAQGAGQENADAEPEADAEGEAGERAQIAIVLERILTGADPDEVCEEFVTERYLRRSYGDAAGCYAAQQDERPARSVNISQVVLNDEALAQAQARPRGGLYDGQVLRAELVLTGGSWKLDSLRSNVPVGP